MTFNVGQRVRFDAEFRDEGGAFYDPKEITCTVRIERHDGTATTETMTLDKGVTRKRIGLFFAIAVMTDDGELTVRFDAGKDHGFSVFRDRVGEMNPETGAEDQLAAEVDPSHAAAHDAAHDASLLEDPPSSPRMDVDEMVAFLRARGVAVDPERGRVFIESMYDAYGGGGTLRADVADTNREHAIEDLKRTIAKGKTPAQNHADRGFITRARPSSPRR